MPKEIPDWIKVIDISKYFAKAIDSLNQAKSISKLLEDNI